MESCSNQSFKVGFNLLYTRFVKQQVLQLFYKFNVNTNNNGIVFEIT